MSERVGLEFDRSILYNRLSALYETAASRYGRGLLILISAGTEDPVGGVDTNFLYFTGRASQWDLLLFDGDRVEILELGPRKKLAGVWHDELRPFGDYLEAATAFSESVPFVRGWWDEIPEGIVRYLTSIISSFSFDKIFTVNSGRYELAARESVAFKSLVKAVDILKRAEVFDISKEIAALRSVKDEFEKLAIEIACRRTSAILTSLLLPISEQRETEAGVAALVQKLAGGRAELAFDPIVSFGDNGYIIHHYPGLRKRGDRDAALVDMGLRAYGYAADVTRMFVPEGGIPGRLVEMIEAVEEAYAAAVAHLAPGVNFRKGEDSVEAVARGVLKRFGEEQLFTHSIGHHVGLDVHDPEPGTDMLIPGNIVTVEPGIYDPATGFGVRIEDTFLLTSHGARRLGTDHVNNVIFF